MSVGEQLRTRKQSRIPGTVYILISFIPWILYWILTGVGKPLGVAVAFLAAVLLVISEAVNRSFNLMDLVSVAFFAVAGLVTFGLKSSLFIDNSGFLGYLALFIMAVVSLILKQPYTLQVSKRDYPETYWHDPTFAMINNIITGLWALIFLANSVIYILLRFPVNVVISNALVALGILFSIIFPLAAPAYFALREFKGNDWRIDIGREGSRGGKSGKEDKGKEQEYDVLIVGSGIGGLTCGALLAREGYRVAVFEQHYLPGGYCSSFRRKGFTFNTGVAAVSGLWEKGPVRYLLDDLGLRQEDLFIRNTSRFIFKGRNIDVPPDLGGLIALLQGMFPAEARRIVDFFDTARKAYEEVYREAEIYGAPLPAELIAKVFGAKALLNYPREHPHFYSWMNKTYKQFLDEHFKSESIKALLSALIGYVGTEPDKTPAASALTAVVSYYLHGGYFPKGGALRFAGALKEYIEEHGGRVLLRHRVDRILVETSEARAGREVQVRGIQVGDRTYESRVVVANVNAKTALLDLVGEEHLKPTFVRFIKGLKMSPSVFMVFLGVDMDLSDYPVLIHNLDEGYGIVIGSNADPDLAPPGSASVTLLASASYHDFPPRGTPEYLQKKEELARALIKKAEKVIPGLSSHIIVKDAATPRTLEFYTGMPEGAIYAFDQSKDTRRPYFKTPIKGLYLASASTFPGGGIEAVVIAGRICANDIMNWKRRA
ncbi:FAD-dependent oxidoreductase [Desulfothermobacter acidiphilus]|uniref:FAD-dependent oxidoreductase n=1 Tax=Desulfothermobacter acidiphilus TaxID=1938353 RepID=UPI003F8CCD2E